MKRLFLIWSLFLPLSLGFHAQGVQADTVAKMTRVDPAQIAVMDPAPDGSCLDLPLFDSDAGLPGRQDEMPVYEVSSCRKGTRIIEPCLRPVLLLLDYNLPPPGRS